jgi:deoxyribodipyrimidine photo-lyase
MAQEMGAGVERSEVLQQTVRREALRREFASREELAEYLRGEFPSAAAVDASISPIRGGKRAAEERLQAIEPRRYAATRNFLDGCVTRLSPYLRHGVVTLGEVRQVALGRAPSASSILKFISELAWRDYWQRLYFRWGPGVWEDREEYKTGWQASDYSDALPDDLARAQTGLPCMDAFARELHETGYVHNHARMWMAAYVVHWRRVRWQAGARWFLAHLLDGDPASNNLSWQWVASTFSHKPYFFNRENLEKYTAGQFCRRCEAECPFDASYQDLSQRLFQIV